MKKIKSLATKLQLKAVEKYYQASPKSKSITAAAMIAGLAFGAPEALADATYTTTGQGFFEAIDGVMKSPLVKGFALVAVLIGILAAAMGNLKAAVLPFGLAAIAGIGPWLVGTIFDLFGTVA